MEYKKYVSEESIILAKVKSRVDYLIKDALSNLREVLASYAKIVFLSIRPVHDAEMSLKPIIGKSAILLDRILADAEHRVKEVAVRATVRRNTSKFPTCTFIRKIILPRDQELIDRQVCSFKRSKIKDEELVARVYATLAESLIKFANIYPSVDSEELKKKVEEWLFPLASEAIVLQRSILRRCQNDEVNVDAVSEASLKTYLHR